MGENCFLSPHWRPLQSKDRVMRLLNTVMICGAALSVAACVQRAPFQTVSESCGHLTGNADLYASCAELVRVVTKCAKMLGRRPQREISSNRSRRLLPICRSTTGRSRSRRRRRARCRSPISVRSTRRPPSPLPNAPALPGPFLGHVPGGPDVYGVPANATPAPQLQ